MCEGNMTYVFKNTDSRIFNQMNLVLYFLIKTLLQNAQIKMDKFLAVSFQEVNAV